MNQNRSEFWRGVRLAVDVGTVRIGVARCDPDGLLASPVVTVPRDRGPNADTPAAGDLAELADLVAEYHPVEVVVGLPVTLSGQESYAARDVRAYAARLADRVAPVPIVFADERMSTAVATRRLSDRGVRGKRRRAVVDQAAAVEILQSWLDAHRRRTDA
ncbi:putative pre-16S rRNA nuclease [Actinocatenispora thailandica]|uniref:Putative pre-16S rRNA nuclease n=1 Tax=Actinocatenispora thailandica TaxID=227318 RepID=A0A7R7HWN9_9ACTN|nr:Holliday junction resolvase RuvX [Actinocatenispora thailandica]BCJ35287.1 putative pre-16S rRNA nuclease [Actinocatenispora thailandica]